MEILSEKIKNYFNNTGFKGLLSLIIYLFLFWIGIDELIKNKQLFILFYIIGIVAALISVKLIINNSQKFIISLRIFILSAVTAGFVKSIPDIETFIGQFSRTINILLFTLLGFFLTGSFIVYSLKTTIKND